MAATPPIVPVSVTISIASIGLVPVTVSIPGIGLSPGVVVAWHVLVLIPVALHKVNAFPAGAVAMAVLSPVLGVTGRHVQVDRRAANRYPFDVNWLWIDDLRRRIAADIDAAIKPGLADTQRNSNIGSKNRSGDGCQYGGV